MTSLVFFGSLVAGLVGLAGLVERNEGQWQRRACAAACLLGLLTAGFSGRDVASSLAPSGTQRIAAEPKATDPVATELIAAQRIGTQPNATKPDGTLRLATDRSLTERWDKVQAEIGPPPSENAIPVVGYVTAAGVRYPSRWRMPPNRDKADNFKQPSKQP